MKKIIVVSLAAFTLSLSAIAQTKTDRGTKGLRKAQRTELMKGIELSEAQKAKLKEDNQSLLLKRKELKANRQNLSKEELRVAHKDIRKARNANLQAVLTKEQATQLEINKKNFIAKKEARRAERASMLKELNLTKEQQVSLKKINQDSRLKLKEIRADQSMKAEDKKIRIAEIRKDLKIQRQGVFTDDQKQIIKNRKAMIQERK